MAALNLLATMDQGVRGDEWGHNAMHVRNMVIRLEIAQLLHDALIATKLVIQSRGAFTWWDI